MASSECVVTLKHGLVVSVGALRTLWSLEDRGFALQPFGARLRVQPVAALTPDDIASIRQHRDELVALVKCIEVIQ